MNSFLLDKNPEKPRILVVPLDWGLGHATRCIPVIRELLAQGAEVWMAGEGAQEQILTYEFPGVPFLPLQGYRVQYGKTAQSLIWKMIRQGPKIQKAIRAEHNWLQKTVNQYAIDAVISDNRYGLFHKSILSVFLTHQLQIISPWGKWAERILQKKNYKYISRFTECWLPDEKGDENFAGSLSHPLLKPAIPVRYIGLLSRFAKQQVTEKKNHLLFLISGPEPQRSIFENKIIDEISHYKGTVIVVRGLPGHHSIIPSTDMIRFYNHLPSNELNKVMQEAEYIISRSGYSTIMDAMMLGKKCIFIPTPGQTEQQYLGDYLMKKMIAPCFEQKQFSLPALLAYAEKFDYKIPFSASGEMLSSAIKNFLHRVQFPAFG